MKIPSLTLLYAYANSAPWRRATVLVVLPTLIIATALFTEYGLGYIPCKLCLMQRWPYYTAIPLGILAYVISGPLMLPHAARPAFAMIGAIFMVSVALGVYHAGVEWAWWQGPADCGGRVTTGPASAMDLMAAMEKTRIVSCTEAPFRILGLSMAGWNAMASFILATIAIRGWRRTYRYKTA